MRCTDFTTYLPLIYHLFTSYSPLIHIIMLLQVHDFPCRSHPAQRPPAPLSASQVVILHTASCRKLSFWQLATTCGVQDNNLCFACRSPLFHHYSHYLTLFTINLFIIKDCNCLNNILLVIRHFCTLLKFIEKRGKINFIINLNFYIIMISFFK